MQDVYKRQGKAFTFIVGKEAYKLRDIERYCKTKMKAQRIPSLDDVANVSVENVFRKLEKTCLLYTSRCV